MDENTVNRMAADVLHDIASIITSWQQRMANLKRREKEGILYDELPPIDITGGMPSEEYVKKMRSGELFDEEPPPPATNSSYGT